ncbi:lysophospholipid acyltransferase family protein [Tellurirhabdus rosea]|uniref:hypothetical protein n=1 Tax=Tellurirhabdus rosea TaxID=2674997 RepID=UPI002259B19B|nr:hypothetical protein [Tellurirhabdus rosea]
MNRFVQHYRKELGLCRQRFETLDLAKEKGYLFKFTTFSANMSNILPEIPADKHEGLFRELLLQQVYTTFDQQFITANEFVKTEGPFRKLVNSKGANIYCTFHLGSYRLLTTFLFRSGIDCALMVGTRVFNEQSEAILENIDQIRQKHGLTNKFMIVDAENTSSTLQVLRELRAGTSLIIYIDGMTTTTGINRQEDKEIRVRLGNRKVWTRKGVAFLSHMAKVPIVPVFSYREKDLNNVLAFQQPIVPDDHPQRDAYCQYGIQRLYDDFWRYLTRYPSQWEGWTYIHSFLDAQDLETPAPTRKVARPRKRIAFNQDRYALCDLEDAPVLFDRRLYLTYEISPDLRDFLLQVNTIESPADVLGEELFQDLLSKQIIA